MSNHFIYPEPWLFKKSTSHHRSSVVLQRRDATRFHRSSIIHTFSGGLFPACCCCRTLLKMQMHYPRHNNPEILAHTKTHLFILVILFRRVHSPGTALEQFSTPSNQMTKQRNKNSTSLRGTKAKQIAPKVAAEKFVTNLNLSSSPSQHPRTSHEGTPLEKKKQGSTQHTHDALHVRITKREREKREKERA